MLGKIVNPWAPILAAWAVGLALGCTDAERRTGDIMATDDSAFAEVKLNSLEPNACSPEPPDAAFRGILIRAPKRVTFDPDERVGDRDAFAAIPICGIYILDVGSMPPHDNTIEAMELVAVNDETEAEYTGRMMDPDPQVPPPADGLPPPDKAENVGVSVSGYFNPNLADYVALPEEPATYTVYVRLGEKITSNEVKIELVEKED